MLRKQINENLLMLKKLVFSSSLLILSTCVFDAHEDGELCVYTVRELEQVVDEMNGFLKEHPDVKLTCPWDKYGLEKDEKGNYIDSGFIMCEDKDKNGKLVPLTGHEECKNARWQVLRESTSTLLKRLVDEGDAVKADVLWGFGITHLLEYKSNLNLIAPYKPKDIGYIEDALEDTEEFPNGSGEWYIDPSYLKRGGDESILPYWVGISAYMNVFCVNEAKMQAIHPGWTEADLTWENLIKPECGVGEGIGKDPKKGECLEGWSYEGLISMPRPDKSGTGAIALSALLHYFKDKEGYEFGGWTYLEKLEKHIGQYTASGTDPCKLAADEEKLGKSSIAVAITGEVGARETKNRNYPDIDENLLILGMEEGSAGYNIEANAVLRKRGGSINPIAQTLMDWGISANAFNIYALTSSLLARPEFTESSPKEIDEPKETWANYDFSDIANSRATDESMWTKKFCPDDEIDKCRGKNMDGKYPVNENFGK